MVFWVGWGQNGGTPFGIKEPAIESRYKCQWQRHLYWSQMSDIRNKLWSSEHSEVLNTLVMLAKTREWFRSVAWCNPHWSPTFLNVEIKEKSLNTFVCFRGGEPLALQMLLDGNCHSPLLLAILTQALERWSSKHLKGKLFPPDGILAADIVTMVLKLAFRFFLMYLSTKAKYYCWW